ncbi:MAG TPA: chemotaxis protein CheB [Caldilineaceae bacterium]|nr:chemotaxis protein CheB [Caldilineaceae bacterium]
MSKRIAGPLPFAIVVVGTSAGGLEVLRRLVGGLPADLPAALFVVQHLFREAVSLLPELLTQSGPLPALHPYNEQPIEPGRIYVAPPDYHLLLTRPGLITLDHGPRENLHRPAIDPLFRTAARTYGPRTVGVILSGAKDDGAAGMLAIKLRGGRTVVQEPADAPYPEMPQSVLEQVEGIDYVAPVAVMPEVLGQLVRQALLAGEALDERIASSRWSGAGSGAPAAHGTGEGEETMGTDAMPSDAMPPDSMPVDPLAVEPDVLICPECGGALALHQQGLLAHYRCHTGHAFGLKSLDAAYAERVEQALWAALSALKERAVLSQRLAERMAGPQLREEYGRQAEMAWRQARVIEELLTALTPPLGGPA